MRKRSAAMLALWMLVWPTAASAEISANYKNGGAVVIGTANDTCAPAIEGAIRWSSVDETHEMCDGTDWKRIIASSGTGDLSTPPSGTGYFVLTQGTWNGGLGGQTGADSKCLTDLTGNTWLNKTDATTRGLLDAAHVHAFLCGASSCSNPLPGVMYTFAVSGNATYGGASFTTSGTGQGPGNTQNWSGTNYFGAAAQTWVGRYTGSPSASLWVTTPPGSFGSCADWTETGSGGWGGNFGDANNTDHQRWQSNARSTCSITRRLICLVNP